MQNAPDPPKPPATAQNASDGPEWRPCRSAPGYRVSSDGNVAHKDAILGQSLRAGHPHVLVCSPKRRRVRVCALVAEAFGLIPCVASLQTDFHILHANGDPTDNRAANLIIDRRSRYSRADRERAAQLRAEGLSAEAVEQMTRVPQRLQRKPPKARRAPSK